MGVLKEDQFNEALKEQPFSAHYFLYFYKIYGITDNRNIDCPPASRGHSELKHTLLLPLGANISNCWCGPRGVLPLGGVWWPRKGKLHCATFTFHNIFFVL